ncbi:hypothetical protein PQR64_26600 [Paraburkholderia phytofirmans]|uniref:hypothetical protein n=1 Tax=Paraburkholderia phytofirmans TaxID=261302 RepID=UPI0038B74475
MGQKFAAYNAQGAITGFYDSEDSPVPAGVADVIEITDEQWQTCVSNQGWTVITGALVAPVPPSAADLAAQALVRSAQTALTTGLKIASTETPALNGTYAVDQLSQSDIIAIETSLNAGKGFPGGAATFSYLDVAGAAHAFSEANFTDFAAAVRDFVYGCRAVIARSSSVLPASTATIA